MCWKTSRYFDVSAGKGAQIKGKSFLPILKRALLLLTPLEPKRIKIETCALSQIIEQSHAIRLSILQVIFEETQVEI